MKKDKEREESRMESPYRSLRSVVNRKSIAMSETIFINNLPLAFAISQIIQRLIVVIFIIEVTNVYP